MCRLGASAALAQAKRIHHAGPARARPFISAAAIAAGQSAGRQQASGKPAKLIYMMQAARLAVLWKVGRLNDFAPPSQSQRAGGNREMRFAASATSAAAAAAAAVSRRRAERRREYQLERVGRLAAGLGATRDWPLGPRRPAARARLQSGPVGARRRSQLVARGPRRPWPANRSRPGSFRAKLACLAALVGRLAAKSAARPRAD